MTETDSATGLSLGFVQARGAPSDAATMDALASLRETLPPDLAADAATAFGAELARCVLDRDASEVADALEQLHVSDLWLAFCARAGQRSAIAELERSCIEPLGPTIGRIDSSESFVDEIRQRTRAKLLVAEPGGTPKLDRYRGRGELTTWVRVVAAREALSAARTSRRRAGVTDDDLLALEASTTGPELGAVKEQYREAFGSAFREAIGSLAPEQRNVLRLHYLHGLTVDDLAALLKVHRSSAARRVVKARSELLAATRQRLQLQLRIDRKEFDALMHLVSSRIDVSIERHLSD